MSDNREQQVIAAFVSLATNLADGEDVTELLSGLVRDCVRLLDVEAAGLLLADKHDILHLVAASSEQVSTLELFQLQRDEGPCLDCYRGGAPVSSDNLLEDFDRWPIFAPAAATAGFVAVHAMPMRLRDKVLGALNLFGSRTGALTGDDRALAQALAHVASVALVQDKAAADKDLINSQLNSALLSRVVIEQAKGVLAEKGQLDMEKSFAALRRYARDNNSRLSDVAGAIVSRELPAQDVLEASLGKRKGGTRLA